MNCGQAAVNQPLSSTINHPTDVYVYTDPLLSPGLSKQLQLVVIPYTAVTGGKKPMPLHEEASLYPYFQSQFLTDFDVTPLILKLRTSSTR